MIGKSKPCGSCSKLSKLWQSHPPRCKACAQRQKPVVVKKRNTPIKKASDKQTRLNAAYSALRKVFLAQHPVCQIKVKCQGDIATDIHHKKSRGQYLLDSTTFISVCRNCHSWCHENDAEARALGFIESKLS